MNQVRKQAEYFRKHPKKKNPEVKPSNPKANNSHSLLYLSLFFFNE